MMVAEGLRLPVSRHFYYSTFAVRGRHENDPKGMFICEGTPGTGFFVRNTESHSYRRFVSECKKAMRQNIRTLLFRKEPNFDKEYERVNKAFETETDENVRRILSCYQNVIGLAKEEELLQRIVRALKDKIGERPNKSLVSVLTHYKSSIAGLEHDARAAQLDYSTTMSEEDLALWGNVVEAFHKLVDSRRVWSLSMEDGVQSYNQVFFDMGIFDYIKSPGDTPVMRDHCGMHYYLYPDGMVEARSSVDMVFHRWSDLEVLFNVVDISTLVVRPNFNSHKKSSKHHNHNDALSTLYGASRGQVVGEICFPEQDLRFFVNHTGPAEDFVKAVNAWKTHSL